MSSTENTYRRYNKPTSKYGRRSYHKKEKRVEPISEWVPKPSPPDSWAGVVAAAHKKEKDKQSHEKEK